MFGKYIVGSTITASVLLYVVLQTTTPSTIGPLGLLAVFFLLYGVLVGLISGLLWGFSNVVAKATRPFTTRKPISPLSLVRAYYFSSVIALAPIMMLAMQSINSLGVYETMLIIAFIGLGLFYVTKRST